MGKIEKGFYWICFFLAIYIVIGFKLIPTVIKDQMISNLDSTLTQETTIKKVDFNPFTFRAKIHEFSLGDKEEKTLSFDVLDIDYAVLRSIFELHVSINQISLKNATINVIENKDGSFNFNKLLKPTKEETKEKEESSSDIKFLISKVLLDNTTINYTKLTNEKPYKLSINNINYLIHDVGTYNDVLASNDLSFKINEHTKVSFAGAFKVSPFKMYGKATIDDLRLQELLSAKA